MSAAKSSAANFCVSFIFFVIIIFRAYCAVRNNRRARYYKRPNYLIIAYNDKFLGFRYACGAFRGEVNAVEIHSGLQARASIDGQIPGHGVGM